LSVEEWHVNIRGDDCYFIGVFFECDITGGILDTENEETSGFAWVDKTNIQEFHVLQPSKKVIESALS
jgi:hypothetical protein